LRDDVVTPALATNAGLIHTIIREAFSGTDFGYQGEAELVRELVADGDELVSIIYWRNHQALGHLFFSRMNVEADGKLISAAGLGPVSVLPEYQGQGIGSGLIRMGIMILEEKGVDISFVLGHESYYPRFGYSPDLAARFASPFAGPHFMAMMLDSDAAWPLGGRADYAPAFGRMG